MGRTALAPPSQSALAPSVPRSVRTREVDVRRAPILVPRARARKAVKIHAPAWRIRVKGFPCRR
jgi:hypothetical protein